MSDTPYSSPVTPNTPQQEQHYNSDVDAQAVQELSGTRPWVMLLAILMFIGTGFMVLAGIIMMVTMGVAGNQLDSELGGAGAGVMGGLGLFYLVFAILYLFPAIFLFRFSSRISDLQNRPDTTSLVEALRQQRKFWKFVGVLTLVSIALSILFSVVAMVIPMMFI